MANAETKDATNRDVNPEEQKGYKVTTTTRLSEHLAKNAGNFAMERLTWKLKS